MLDDLDDEDSDDEAQNSKAAKKKKKKATNPLDDQSNNPMRIFRMKQHEYL